MKTHVLLLILIWATLSTNAQITLTNFHTYDIGTTATYLYSEPIFDGLDQSGENVIWDASVEGFQEAAESYTIPSDAGNSKLFPESNLAVISITENWEEYYQKTDNELIYHGFIIEDFILKTYTDPLTELIFPMSYGDSYIDTYESFTELDFGDSTSETGTLEVTADAYGDLILPYGTIENTLRVKYVRIGEELLLGYPSPTSRISYKWFDLEYGNEIAIYSIQEDPGYGTDRFFEYISEMDYTSIKDQSSANKPKIYPNPASEYFQISGVDSGSDYKLMNQQGQEVLSGIINGEERIYTAEFSTGIYFLEIKNNKGVTRKKIVVQ